MSTNRIHMFKANIYNRRHKRTIHTFMNRIHLFSTCRIWLVEQNTSHLISDMTLLPLFRPRKGMNRKFRIKIETNKLW